MSFSVVVFIQLHRDNATRIHNGVAQFTVSRMLLLLMLLLSLLCLLVVQMGSGLVNSKYSNNNHNNNNDNVDRGTISDMDVRRFLGDIYCWRTFRRSARLILTQRTNECGERCAQMSVNLWLFPQSDSPLLETSVFISRDDQ